MSAAQSKPKPATKSATPAKEQVAPVKTAAPVRCAFGLQRDQYGLPVNGAARAGVLAKLDIADPLSDLSAWQKAEVTADAIEKAVQAIYGDKDNG